MCVWWCGGVVVCNNNMGCTKRESCSCPANLEKEGGREGGGWACESSLGLRRLAWVAPVLCCGIHV